MLKSFLEQVGERIQYFREIQGWDRKKLAEICGVSFAVIYGIEKGHIKPPYSLYEDICITLGYTAKELFSGFGWTYTPPVKREEGSSFVNNKRTA